MRSVKLRIPGSYWDSQIYSGELIIFGDDGSVQRVDWAAFVDRIAAKHPDVQTAIRVAFSDSDLFYNPKVRKVLRDPQIEHPIVGQLNKLADLHLETETTELAGQSQHHDSPFDFLPIDTEIYHNEIYAGGEGGLFSFPRSASLSKVKSRLDKHHDASVFQVKASDRFSAIATATGKDGLFDFILARTPNERKRIGNPRQVATRPCNACDWAFQSIIGWSSQLAFLASFREFKDADSKKKLRVFNKIIDSSEIFGATQKSANDVVWGSREKIYRLSEGHIYVANYEVAGNASRPDETFEQIGHFSFTPSSEIIATGTAPFGTVLEMEDRIIVLRSDGKLDVFSGTPIHWRVFPRSEHYSNQLHIIYEDAIEIISFTHDYFVNQGTKMFGFAKTTE
ncbi:hypothetical protein JYG38_15300 [Pseudomonas rhodesiae]|uniref:hypothetical protein n=1 Tax=Pseudomonas rhodesiae TaxID=76760 RepID=UPI001BCAD56A|nr:hypothetical protein [Pseudomonas rhodesiae]QVM99618.1 hypothetical protein JYG38_15300 [Pseudomonas rhodesiae]